MKRTKKSFSTRLSLNILLIVSILFITALVAASIFSHRLISREAMKSADNLCTPPSPTSRRSLSPSRQ